MRLKDLFTVPTGQKVTEKHLRRVLISSICSILLCMTCLVSTTWAWFAVSIENSGNVIQIGTPDVKLTVNDESFESGNVLPEGTNNILIEHANELDDLQKKSTLYVTFIVNDEVKGYVILESSNGYKTDITIQTGESYPFSWTASWFEPDADPLTTNAISLIDEEAESTDGVTEPDETTAPTEATTSTEMTTTTETVTESSTETTTESSTESSTDAATESSTESSTEDSTESSTEPSTGAETEPSTESSVEATPESTTESTGGTTLPAT